MTSFGSIVSEIALQFLVFWDGKNIEKRIFM